MILKHSQIYKSRRIFGSYLAGLWEGLPKGQGHLNRKARPTYKPKVGFSFGLNQLVLAEKIKLYFELESNAEYSLRKKAKRSKICSLNAHPVRKAVTLTLLDVSALKLFLNLTLPYLRTPKAQRLNFILDYFDLVHKQRLPQARVNLTKKSFRNDAWLTGFCDADGSFGLRQTLIGAHAKHKLTELTFILTQRQVQTGAQASVATVFRRMARFLKCTVTSVLMPASKGKPQFRLKLTSAKSKKILRAYFDTYPLMSSKHYDYCDWCTADDLMKQNAHYSTAGQIEFLKLKAGVNQNRKVFTWVHLENWPVAKAVPF